MCLGMIDRPQYRRNQIFYMHKVALYRQALRIEHHWNSLRSEILIRSFGTNKIAPSWPAKHIFAKRKLIPEIVLLHDPRGAQAAPGQSILNVILLQNHFIQHLR
jgi:hypothetical protein